MDMISWEDYPMDHGARFINVWLDFLRLPNISALPAHAGEVRRTAQWVESRIKAAGIESVRILPTVSEPRRARKRMRSGNCSTL
jgi:hypothetical protein